MRKRSLSTRFDFIPFTHTSYVEKLEFGIPSNMARTSNVRRYDSRVGCSESKERGEKQNVRLRSAPSVIERPRSDSKRQPVYLASVQTL